MGLHTPTPQGRWEMNQGVWLVCAARGVARAGTCYFCSPCQLWKGVYSPIGEMTLRVTTTRGLGASQDLDKDWPT